eukprot:GHRR01002603.1.p1 GENE.GHRR01002603.1~~GHRR01002603.1.p1  ORF type:complete len:266 (+),score=58.35 GHRR01002603.1:270-1067(+)
MWEFWRGKLNTDHTSPRSNVFPLKANDQRGSAVVNFKDLNLSVDELPDDVHTDSSYHEDEDPTNKAAIIRTKGIRSDAQKNKLIIIMVGLPGRGKTFLCNKLKCYLNWLGHNTSHFNVGNYRRLQKEGHEMQDASFFDSQNKLGLEARSRALMTAIDDVMSFLTENNGQVDIFDATNTTTDRRQMLVSLPGGLYRLCQPSMDVGFFRLCLRAAGHCEARCGQEKRCCNSSSCPVADVTTVLHGRLTLLCCFADCYLPWSLPVYLH